MGLIVLLSLLVGLVSSSTFDRARSVPNLRHRNVPQTACAICLNDVNTGPRMVLPPCDHEFHRNCITDWIARNRLDCPLCRSVTTMDVSNITRVPKSPREYIGWEFGIFDALLDCLRCLGAAVPGTYTSIDD